MINLLKLHGRQKELLRLRIRRWNGLVRIFVHPLYEKWRWPSGEYATHPDYKQLANIESVLSRLIAMPEGKTPPIIIMEEQDRLAHIQRWLKENLAGHSQKNVYYVSTLRNDPRPVIENLSYWKKEEAWKRLIKRLDSISVKRILIGGMQFRVCGYRSDWTQRGPFVDKCVGITISYLSKDKAGHFELDLSTLVDCSRSRQIYIQYVNETRLSVAG